MYSVCNYGDGVLNEGVGTCTVYVTMVMAY